MILDEVGKIWIIDFNLCNVGITYEEINPISWCVNTSEAFSRGRVDGYFVEHVSEEFWELYIATNLPSSLP